ncbi:MAG: hypothetical protein LUF02_08065 [Erysipelotrichaceae bacterium]|nr:hypothetical protein [Erysipelotrichaceae bacterium]
MKYKIVYIKDEYKDLITYYPHFIEWIYKMPTDNFSVKQIEIIFEPIQKGKQYLLQMFEKRDDYQYFHGVHILHNSLTKEVIKIKMNEYDIEVDENYQKHDIYDILKAISHNFYIII